MARGIRSMVRSMASAVVQLGEDPEVLLGHLHQDLEALVPGLDGQLAWVSAAIRLLEKEMAAPDQPEATRRSNRIQLTVLREAHRHALETKRTALGRIQERCREVAAFLPAHEESAWRARISETVSRLARADIPAELEERIAAIQEEAARAESA